MKYLKILIGFYLAIFSLALIQSCCRDKLKIVSSASMEAWEMPDSVSKQQITSVTGDFLLEIHFITEVVTLPSSYSINTAYAFKCDREFVNYLDESTYELFLNRPFYFKNDTIPANSNLLELDDNGIITKTSDYEGVTFFFTDFFIENSEFENEDYTFLFKGSTDDKISFSAELTIPVNL